MPLFDLKAPTRATFIISVVLFIAGLVINLASIELPIPIFPSHGFAILLLSYLVLLAGNIFRGV